MNGIVIRYEYRGDEAVWQAAVDAFIAAIGQHDAARGKFRYTVTRSGDGITRTHMGRWDSPETLAAVQSSDYFKVFSKAVQEMAGDGLQSARMTVSATTD